MIQHGVSAGGDPRVDELSHLARAPRLGRPVVLAAATAVPVRHKPGSRCVLRYRLTVQGAAESVTVFGELLVEPLQAVAVDAITRRLHAEQAESGETPVVPRPLGAVEAAGLALSAAGAPVTALVAAAEAISRRHSSSVGLREGGAPAVAVAASLRRMHLYEAALLLRIAARRPAELAAMLDEVDLCLATPRAA